MTTWRTDVVAFAEREGATGAASMAPMTTENRDSVAAVAYELLAVAEAKPGQGTAVDRGTCDDVVADLKGARCTVGLDASAGQQFTAMGEHLPAVTAEVELESGDSAAAAASELPAAVRACPDTTRRGSVGRHSDGRETHEDCDCEVEAWQEQS